MSEDFFTALVLRHPLINAALHQTIKLLPFQHSSFQASGRALQFLFCNRRARMHAALGTSTAPEGLRHGFIVQVHALFTVHNCFVTSYQMQYILYKEHTRQVFTDLAHHTFADS